MHAELAATEQHVVGAHGELLATQVLDLARVEAGQHLFTEIGRCRGTVEQARHACAVRPRIAMQQRRVDTRVPLGEVRVEALEVALGQVAARQVRTLGPGSPVVIDRPCDPVDDLLRARSI